MNGSSHGWKYGWFLACQVILPVQCYTGSTLCRRLLKDDGRGVAEALNETVCAHDKCMGLTVSRLPHVVLLI